MIQKYLKKMIQYSELGYYEQALILGNKMIEAFPDDRTVILYVMAEIKIRFGNKKEALIDMVQVYQESFNLEIYDKILNMFLMSYEEGLRKQYEVNMLALLKYPYYKNEFDTDRIQYYVLWMDDDILVSADLHNKRFTVHTRNKKIKLQENREAFAIVNELWMDNMPLCEQDNSKEKSYQNNIPMYLLYDRYYWQLFLQKCNVMQLIDNRRTLFFIGKTVFRDYLNSEMSNIPKINYFNGFEYEWKKLIHEAIENTEIEYRKNQEEVVNYYKQNKANIAETIKKGKPKILFYTSRFTTVLQYHIRDCLSSAIRSGCNSKLIIEPDDLHYVTLGYIMKMLADFKPDIVFCIDHFKFEYINTIEELIWICWAQDPIGYIMDKETPHKLGERDFVMNHFITWKNFFDVGYSKHCLIDAPIPASSLIYQNYKLTPLEIDKYGCDICFVCHASDAEKYVKEKVKQVEKQFANVEVLDDIIYTIYDGYRNFVYDTAQCFYSKNEFKEYINNVLNEKYGVKFSTLALEFFAEDMYVNFNQRVYRQALVDWILDAGFTNIKLWGNGWLDSEKYQAYAMGPAENGETLSRIYQASKIVIGNNVMTTSAARAWETMLSGGFYLSNYIPEEDDVTDIRKIIEVGKDVIMFYGKEDLITKIRYYLEHEKERQIMIERGRKAALENMTFDILMKRTLSEVAKRLEENDNG